MPVKTNSDLWSRGDTRSDVRQQIVGHMQRNRSTAYTPLELWEELFKDTENPYDDSVCCKTLIASLLEDLCNNMEVECRMIEKDGETRAYYSFTDNIHYM